MPVLDGFAFQNMETVPVEVGRRLKRLQHWKSNWLNDLAPRSSLLMTKKWYLNHTFRGKNKTTDVLSFSAWEGEAMPGLTHILGDIVISVPMAQKQARGLGHSLGDELIVLAIHGLLHLLGLDHERDEIEATIQAECEMGFLDLIGVDIGLCLSGRSFG